MDTRSKNNSSGISLEEKFANVSSQLSSVTERLGHVEHDLDLERASREDIIKAEVERRVKEMERALEAKYEERENALMCDAYAGYDWAKKSGRVLCRCDAHAR